MSAWDTSGLLKLYFEELDSPTFRALAARGAPIVISVIARYEMEAVFRRKEVGGGLQPGDAIVFQRQFETSLQTRNVKAVPLGAEMEKRLLRPRRESGAMPLPRDKAETPDALPNHF